MKLKNPQTFSYEHQNFNGQTVDVALNQNPVIGGFLDLSVGAPNGRSGVAQLQFKDNGNVVIRVHLGPMNPIHVLVLDDSGVIFEQ